MTIERWRPARDLDRFQSWINQWLTDGFEGRNFLLDRPDAYFMPVDLKEVEQGYELELSVPGYRPEDVHIDINQDRLTVRGEMKEQANEEKKDNYIYRERRSGSFFRELRLPAMVDSSKVEATMKDGVLKLELPKMVQTPSTRIAIKNGK